MMESVHRLGSSIRNSRLLKQQRWLWDLVEPAWQGLFAAASRKKGFAARVNADTFRLSYEYAARYDRADRQAYEPDFYAPFVASIKPGMTVLDVGAHIGLFTLGAATRVGPGGKVFAFEAAPATARTLEQHVEMNHFGRIVEVVPKIVSDKSGEMTFYSFGESMAASINRENTQDLNPEHPKAVKSVTLPCTSLDEFCGTLRPDVIKIDIEGAEYMALRGAEKILRSRCTSAILCEIHPQHMRNCGGSEEELAGYLDGLGYRIVALDARNPQGIYHASIVAK